MLAAARQLGRALVGADCAVSAQCRQALILGAADFSTKAGSHGRPKRSTPKAPMGLDDALPSLDDVPLDAMDAKEFQRRVEELAAQSAQRPASATDADDTAMSAMEEIHAQFEAAMAHVRNRAVMDHEEDRIDFHGMSAAEVGALKQRRLAERREKWGRWAAAFPEDAARLAADAEWPLQEIPERAAAFYEGLRDYEGVLGESPDGQQQPSGMCADHQSCPCTLTSARH